MAKKSITGITNIFIENFDLYRMGYTNNRNFKKVVVLFVLKSFKITYLFKLKNIQETVT